MSGDRLSRARAAHPLPEARGGGFSIFSFFCFFFPLFFSQATAAPFSPYMCPFNDARLVISAPEKRDGPPMGLSLSELNSRQTADITATLMTLFPGRTRGLLFFTAYLLEFISHASSLA